MMMQKTLFFVGFRERQESGGAGLRTRHSIIGAGEACAYESAGRELFAQRVACRECQRGPQKIHKKSYKKVI